jgi:hypothetical protein
VSPFYRRGKAVLSLRRAREARAYLQQWRPTGRERQRCCGCDSSGSVAVAGELAGAGGVARWPVPCGSVELGDDDSGRLN